MAPGFETPPVKLELDELWVPRVDGVGRLLGRLMFLKLPTWRRSPAPPSRPVRLSRLSMNDSAPRFGAQESGFAPPTPQRRAPVPVDGISKRIRSPKLMPTLPLLAVFASSMSL